MPLHFNSMTNDNCSEHFVWLLQEGMDQCDSIHVTEDKKYIHLRLTLEDTLSGEAIGKVVYTLLHGEKALEILDLDIVWNNDICTPLQFNELRDGSSDSNEYYEAETVGEGQHLEIETVNRHVITEELLDTEREVFISAFPFELSVFSDIDAFNAWAGFEKKTVAFGDLELRLGGFSDKFMMPGGIADEKKKRDESYSFVVGTVLSYRDVELTFGEAALPFVLAKVDTALGAIPVAMGREVFDLKELKVGCIVAMNADIKADLARDEDFMYTHR